MPLQAAYVRCRFVEKGTASCLLEECQCPYLTAAWRCRFVEKGTASLDSVQVGSLSLLHLCGMLPDCGPEVSLQGTRSCTSMHPVQL